MDKKIISFQGVEGSVPLGFDSKIIRFQNYFGKPNDFGLLRKMVEALGDSAEAQQLKREVLDQRIVSKKKPAGKDSQ